VFDTRGRRADEQLAVLRAVWANNPDGVSFLADLIALMRDEAASIGRDPDSLEISLGHLVTKIDPDRVEKLAKLGADRLVLAMPPTADIGEALDLLSACAERLSLKP
jgi:hypothetical protein